MKKTTIVIAVVSMVAAMLATPLAGAVPPVEKNNAKFQTYHVTATLSFTADFLQIAQREYIPSIDNIEKLVMTIPEHFITYAVTVDGHTYTLGADFAYSGVAVYTYNQPEFNNPRLGLAYPSGSAANHTIVNYSFDFSAYPGGLEGTLELRAEFNAGGRMINSLAGTGDFQNVQVKAAATNSLNPVTLILTISHDGTVIGWPE